MIKDRLTVKEVVHKVRDNSQARVGGGVVAVSCQFTRLKSIESLSPLVVQVRAVGVEPLHRLSSDGVAVFMIDEGEGAMRDKVRKNERSRALSGFDGHGERWVEDEVGYGK